MSVRNALVALALALAVAACGQSQHDQVKAKVQEFVGAVTAKDYKTLCDDVLSPQLLADLRLGGLQCVQALRISLAHLKRPSLAIGTITVSGSSASVLTLSAAKGQQATLTAIKLVKTGGGWRINSLGSPIPPHP